MRTNEGAMVALECTCTDKKDFCAATTEHARVRWD